MRGSHLRHPWPAVLAALVAACSHASPPPPAPAAPPAAPVVAPHAASGTYDLTTNLPTHPPAQTSRSRSRARQAPAAAPTLELVYRQVAAPDTTAASSTQFSATINLPGYTRAPRGRSGQAAVWWPLPGDSVIVHVQPPQGPGLLDLRGALRGDTLSGDVWYTSVGTGTSFQMGSFRAVKRKK